MPYCSKCGTAISDGDEFCKSCGTNLQNKPATKKEDDVVRPQESPPTIAKHPVYEPNFPPPATPPSSPPLSSRTSTKKSNNIEILLSVFLGLAIIGAGILGFLYFDATNTIDVRDQTIGELNSDISNLQSQLSDSEFELTTTKNDFQDLNDQLSTTINQLTTTQDQLTEIQSKYPLKNFSSLFQLQAWANNHIQPYQQYANGTYAGALEIQEAAMNEGYLVSACLEETSSGLYFISMQAMIGSTLYWWHPEDGNVYLYLNNIN
ncbi:conserved hypothetical protein [Dehalogenimonas lykanthroporepellens BL-DC-9]|jgi:hypothetical protein|nr:conserved hypothetical protein [Dehalogenimonas lykanthroporepellens BL-DC-9]